MSLRKTLLAAVICLAGVVAMAQPGQQSRRQADVVFIPTPDEVVAAMLDMAKVKSTDVVYDLGSGDGKIPILAAKKYGARGVGIEINPVLIQDANENARQAGVAHLVKFIQGDLFEADIRDATVVTLFLLESLNARLRPKLFAELRPGSRIVSHEFGIGDWRPEKSIEVVRRRVHLWRIPQPTTK